MKNHIRFPSPTTHKRPCVEFQVWSLDAWEVMEREHSKVSSVNLWLTLPKEGWVSRAPINDWCATFPALFTYI